MYIYPKVKKNMIIIPDIHGRSFWKKAIEGHENEEIIFLGDYMDPYLYEEEFADFGDPEMDNTAIDRQDLLFKKIINNFKDIIEFKKAHSKNVILLLGNHDLHYLCIDKGSRYDYLNAGEIFNVLNQNRNLFQMAYEKEINGKRFIFSHAGISKRWLESHSLSLKGWNEENIVDWVNNAYFVRNGQFSIALNDVSNYRGGFNYYGSMVWADFREYIKNLNFSENENDEDNGLIGDYQIFGHTQLEENPIIWDDFANLDCRRAFILNEKGQITEINGKILNKTKNEK